MATAVVTGGAGFLGSHLCERLVGEGWRVVCLDSLLTGDAGNVASLRGEDRFRFEERDVTHALDVDGDVDWVLHFASPASPRDYLDLPIETLEVGSLGTLNALRLAHAKGAGFMVASTSEVYGDPKEHPQKEAYWGNVNPIGPRSVYDEAKRFTEAVTMAFHRTHGIPVKIIRIFNTYGPRMRRNDGRAVPNFVDQALRGRPLTIHGDGTQTRSLCYVDDLIEGIYRFLRSDERGPMNIGNPHEVTILELARVVNETAGAKSEVVFEDRPVDDPEMRCPDISYARSALGWEPVVPLEEGLARTVEWAAEVWRDPV
ncbi:MAG TPA: UDP-glucuronic acid decarboxylase family protein [Actinomycetota bacterium]|nr:UDP-glucuronic acid decarboxylase family protein [Actinomycetota bacterium]